MSDSNVGGNRGGCALIVLLAAAALYFWVRDTTRKNEQARAEETAAWTRIALSEVDVEDVALNPESWSGGYRLTGRVRNRSNRYALTKLALALRILDCTAPNRCETVGQQVASLHPDVPPGQVRGLDQSILFSNLPRPRGRFTFTFTIMGLSGR